MAYSASQAFSLGSAYLPTPWLLSPSCVGGKKKPLKKPKAKKGELDEVRFVFDVTKTSLASP